MAAPSSMRAGGIHWAATMEASGFAKGARTVKNEMLALQSYLKKIASSDMDYLDKMQLAAPLLERKTEMEQNAREFDELTKKRLKDSIEGLARYETYSSKAIVANKKMGMSFKELNAGLKSAFGRGSDFKEFLELAAGAGAIAGIGLLANAIGRMGAAFRKANEDVFTGTKLWQESLADFARSIPILGAVGGAIGDVALSVSANGRASAGERAWWQRKASAGNAQFFDMVQARQASERTRTDEGRIREAARQRLSQLRNLSGDNAIGPGQFASETAKTIAERDRLLKEMEPNKLAARIGDLFQTKANTVNHWLKKMQADVEAFNERTNKRLEASTDRWVDRIRTKSNTFMHAFRELEKQRDAFNAERDRKRAAQDDFIGGARGFFDRLRDIENAPVRFGAALEVGSQAEFEARQKAIFGGTVTRQDEKELAKKAVELQKKEVEQGREVLRLLKDAMKELGVTDFGGN